MNLALSILALLLGPFIYAAGRRQPMIRQVLDSFVLIAVSGIVCVHIVPDAIEGGGKAAVVALIFGLLFPVVIEKIFHHSVREAHTAIVLLAALAVAVHAVIDGVALAEPGIGGRATGILGFNDGSELATGVILHRLPVGMAIWWSVRPSFGIAPAIATFALIGVATSVAYFMGGDAVAWAETREVALFQAFVAGSLVHVVAFGSSHEHDGDKQAGSSNLGYRIGILLAMFVLFTVPRLQ